MKGLRTLRWVGAFVGLAVLLCAGLVAVLLAQIHPDRADPAVVRVRRENPAVTRTLASAPCAVPVRVQDLGGQPIAGAHLQIDDTEGTVDTDADGAARLPSGCQRVRVTARAAGFAPERETTDGTGETELVITLSPGQRVYGNVHDPDGTPIAAANLLALDATATTDANGEYELWVRPQARRVSVDAIGYDDDTEAIPHTRVVEDTAAPELDEVELDFELTPNHEVLVWCTGLTDELCPDMPVQCTDPWLLIGEPCQHQDDGKTVCDCPDGEVAVRGGGRAVLLDADETEAWLDMRDTGTLVGRAVRGGQPVNQCFAEAIRIPEALEDLPRGLVAAARAACESDGTFRIEGLIAGDWELHLEHWGDSGTLERTLVPRHVRIAETVDVGDVDIDGGGVLAGIVTDGVTGEPARHTPVLAWREGAPGERITPSGDDTDADGAFRIVGLPGGTWSVAPILSPQQAVTVTLREGETRDGLRIVTSEATSLAENGFDLTDDAGRLVVSDVAPDTPADAAGLEPGDVVTGVRIAGFELSDAMGSFGDDFTRAVLGHWDGPGVTLVVESPEGGEELVPLEW